MNRDNDPEQRVTAVLISRERALGLYTTSVLGLGFLVLFGSFFGTAFDTAFGTLLGAGVSFGRQSDKYISGKHKIAVKKHLDSFFIFMLG